MNRMVASWGILFLMLMGCAPSADCQLVMVYNNTFSSMYDLKLLCPKQVEWKLYADELGKVSREPNWTFRTDINNRLAVARHSDYNNSGYDRGHLCPAADRSANVDLIRTTFAMSNIAPQKPQLNRGSWLKTERICRELAEKFDSIGIVVIPVFLSRDTMYIGKHRLAVPHAFLKAAWRLDNDSVLYSCFVWNE